MDSQLFDTKTDPLTGRARFSVPHNQTRTSKAAAAHVEKTEGNNTVERRRVSDGTWEYRVSGGEK